MTKLDASALDQLFVTARSHNDFLDTPVTAEQIAALYDLTKIAPTSANCSPARFVFVSSDEGKKRLLPHLMESNQAKTAAAPVCAIIAYDTKFYDLIPQLFPHNPEARDWFAHDEDVALQTAMLNGSLQGAYLMMAARALGLDVGPMSGFDAAGVDNEFFPDGRFKTNFLCNIGHGDAAAVFERSPRLSFDEACEIV
jgi:3-hydroxypropanoate dehydrogenase